MADGEILLTDKIFSMNFTLLSNTIKEGVLLSNEQVYNNYGCAGENISPDLEWFGAPDGTKSFALIMHDPDATNQNIWYHWIVINIPVTKTSFAKDEEISSEKLVKTSFGKPGYGGPCPPKDHGKHRYIFTVYALDVAQIAAEPNIAPEEIETLIKPHILNKASILTYYERN